MKEFPLWRDEARQADIPCQNRTTPLVNPVVCSVVTRSHLCYARALSSSLQRHCLGWKLLVLVVDGEAGRLPTLTGARILTLADVGVQDGTRFCFQYTAFELCNALKPALMKLARAQFPGSPVLYLDSDMYVAASLNPLVEALQQDAIVLTPHVLHDYPATRGIHSTATLMTHGFFNAGVVGVGAGRLADSFLDWWEAKLRHDCLDDVPRGLYVDQKFLDCVPWFFDGVQVCRHPGVNVGKFNLHERTLGRSERGWTANGQDLLLFHATHLDAESGRFHIEEANTALADAAVKSLVETYAAEVREARGQLPSEPYGFGCFSDGTAILAETRRAFRDAWVSNGAAGTCKDPFSSPEWLAWQKRWERKKKVRSLAGRAAAKFMPRVWG